MKKSCILSAAAVLLCLTASAQYLPVQPNPYGERPRIGDGYTDTVRLRPVDIAP